MCLYNYQQRLACENSTQVSFPSNSLLALICSRIKEVSPDAIHNSSTSISTTLSHRKDESGCHRGRLRIYTNDTHLMHVMWSS
jgi:formamidopyrimidine-DNA glycosylase